MSETLSEQVENYTASLESERIIRAQRTIMLAGITGAGKDTLLKNLLTDEQYSGDYYRIVTHTTRGPRDNQDEREEDGVDYHFVSEAALSDLLKDHQMVEVNQFGDKFYGTSTGEFVIAQEKNRLAIGDVDINGIIAFHHIAQEMVTAIFIVPPDYDTWQGRLLRRYNGSTEKLAESWSVRRDIAINELEQALAVPYFHFVINDDIERATGVIHSIAHREKDFFKRADDEARLAARALLDTIKTVG